MGATTRAWWACRVLLREAFKPYGAEPTTVVLTRHGQPETPGEDSGLSVTGRDQAQRLARRIAAGPYGPPATVVASELRRTQETARIVADLLGLTVETDAEFGEIRFNAWDDPSLLEDAKLQRIARTLGAEGVLSAMPWCEPGSELRPRTMAAVRRLAERHPGRTVLIVGHLIPINAILAEVLRAQRDYFFFPELTSISAFRLAGPYASLVSINDTAHLGGEVTGTASMESVMIPGGAPE